MTIQFVVVSLEGMTESGFKAFLNILALVVLTYLSFGCLRRSKVSRDNEFLKRYYGSGFSSSDQ